MQIKVLQNDPNEPLTAVHAPPSCDIELHVLHTNRYISVYLRINCFPFCNDLIVNSIINTNCVTLLQHHDIYVAVMLPYINENILNILIARLVVDDARHYSTLHLTKS